MNENKNHNIEDTSKLLTASKPSGSKRIILIVGIIAAVVVVSVAAGVGIAKFAESREEKQAITTIADEDIDTDSLVKRDDSDQNDAGSTKGIIDDVYSAYADILEEYEYDIRDYDWQYDSGNRCVAVTDLGGDGIPELLFFSADNEAVGTLRVFTYRNGNAVECDYDNSLVYDEYSSNIPEDGLFNDIQVAAGTRYMVYTGKRSGTFYIAYTMGDESTYYHSIKYGIEDNYYITALREVSNKYGPNADYNGHVDEYYVNGGRVSNNAGTSEFKEARDDFGSLIMYSNYVEDMKVFEYTRSTSPMAMSYDEAMHLLR